MDVLLEQQGQQQQGRQLQGQQQQHSGDAVFLYRLVPGYCAPTFGLHCAQVSVVGCMAVVCKASTL